MAVVCACLPMFRRLFEQALGLRTSEKTNSDPVTKATDRHLGHKRSFDRLHESSDELWKERDGGKCITPITTTTIGRAALGGQHGFEIALDEIRVTHEVQRTDISS